MSKITKRSPAVIICAVCNKSFSLIKNLNRHRMNIHGLDRIQRAVSKTPAHKCPVCGLIFVERSSLRRHERIKHAKNFTESLRKKKSIQHNTFYPTHLAEYPLFQKLVPEGYIYKVNEFQDLEENKFRVKFEIPDCTKNMLMIWLSEMTEKSNVRYRVKSYTKSPSSKVVFNKVFRCVHNTFPLRYSIPHPKHTACPATLTLRVQKCWETMSLTNSKGVEEMMRISLKAIGTLKHDHNHNLLSPLSSTDQKEQTKDNAVCSDGSISSNTSFGSEKSSKNDEDNNSIMEVIKETIVPNEPESNEIEINDKIKEIQKNQTKGNKVCSDIGSNTLFGSEKSSKNDEDNNSIMEVIEETVVSNEPESNEIEINDEIKEIQKNQTKGNKVCSDISSNTLFGSEKSSKNDEDNNSIMEVIEETVVSNEPESNEIEINDEIKEIQKNQTKGNKVCSDISSNTLFGSEKSSKNDEDNNSIMEVIEETIVSNEPESNEIEIKEIQKNQTKGNKVCSDISSNTLFGSEKSSKNDEDNNSIMEVIEETIVSNEPESNEIEIKEIQKNQTKGNKVCSDISSNTLFGSEKSSKNDEDNNSIMEVIEETIVPNEPESNEIEINDEIKEIPSENDNFELSKELDNYILVENVNTEISQHNDADGNELNQLKMNQLLSDYDGVNEKMLQQFKSNPEYFLSAIKAYTREMKKNLTCKQLLLDGLHSFGNMLREKL